MYEIVKNLYVGTPADLNYAAENGFSILGVCKDPLHRQYARLKDAEAPGYITKSMPADEPEYLYAEREHALYCNLIDAPDAKYIPPVIINRALEFLKEEWSLFNGNKPTIVVCNHAKSRSPSVAFMHLIKIGFFDVEKEQDKTGEEMIELFRNHIYHAYEPGKGFAEYTIKFWEDYKNGKKKTV